MRGSRRWDSFRASLGIHIFGMCFDESGTDGAECTRKVVSGRRVARAIRSFINAWHLQLECASLA